MIGHYTTGAEGASDIGPVFNRHAFRRLGADMTEEASENDNQEEKTPEKTITGPPVGPPAGPPSGPPSGPPTGPPGRGMGGRTMFGGGPPQPTGPPMAAPSAPTGAQRMHTGSDVAIEAAQEKIVESKKMVDADEKVELESLRQENENLKQGMAAAVEYIQDVENPPMPPIVGDGFVVPGDVVGMFATLGRQLHKERLLHGTAGSFSLLSTTVPNLVHITRQGAALGLMNENDLITGRLGDAAPIQASEDWRIHSVALAIASLDHEGRGACVHVAAPYTTTLSLEKDRYALVPTDYEGRTNYGRATIVDVQYSDMEGYLNEITEALKQTGNKLFVARGHGIYALGSDLLEAWGHAAAFEHSMRILYLSELADL
ncbi:MAG: hypothetical protein CMB37_01430 [Euryarchaeota archaeon]|nr:hypothetical protein [Euryarchaeota archaeon]